jgi:phosphate ABC transporter phosphate-binding protein
MPRFIRVRSRAVRLLLVVIATALILASTVVTARAEPSAPAAPEQALPPVSGAGSTWSQNAIEVWRAAVTRQGLSINYQGVGSSAGRNLFRDGNVDFGVSEVPYQGGEALPPFPFVYLPIVAGGTAVMYKLKGTNQQQITNLRMSPTLVAQIFTRKITKWNDPAIANENPGVALPSTDITVVVRSDGSGTSFQFSAFLVNRAPQLWADFARANNIRNAPTSNWPTLTGASSAVGSDGVADKVSQGNGAITYAETSYALDKSRNLPVVAIRNQAGNYTLPTAKNVSIALTAARFNPDRTQILDGVYVHPDANAYPISSYSYMLARTTGMNPDKGRVIARFVYYFACAGQDPAMKIGYSPMPANLVRAAFEAITQVPGAETPPAIAPATCKNPAITGAFNPGPGGGSPTTTRPTGSGPTTTRPGGGGPTTTSPTGSGSGDGSGSDGTPIDLDGDGIPDGLDTDGDGIIDETLNGEELASSLETADGAVDVKGDMGSDWPFVLAAVALLLLIAIPPILLASNIPGRRWWHRLFLRS